MASHAPADADTFPKLLIRNARSFGNRPAMRHKDLGIWQTLDLGAAARRGPRLCGRAASPRASSAATPWPSSAPTGRGSTASVMAAQMLGVVPVPVYADAVADELSYVLAHAEVRFAAVEDQEQVDKILSVSDRLPKLETMVYDEPRGLRDYDHTRLHADRGRHRRRPQGAGGGRRRSPPGSTPRSQRARAPTPRSSSTPPAPPGSPRAWCCRRERCIGAALRHRRLRQAHRARRGAGLSAARLGRRPLSQLRAGPDRRLLHGLPGKRRDRDGRICARSGRRSIFAPPRTFEKMLTRVMIRMEDASFLKRQLFHYFPRRGAPLRRGDPQPAAGAAARPAAVWARQRAGLRAAEERARAFATCASPTPPARRSGRTCSRSTARSA